MNKFSLLFHDRAWLQCCCYFYSKINRWHGLVFHLLQNMHRTDYSLVLHHQEDLLKLLFSNLLIHFLMKICIFSPPELNISCFFTTVTFQSCNLIGILTWIGFLLLVKIVGRMHCPEWKGMTPIVNKRLITKFWIELFMIWREEIGSHMNKCFACK